jgi:hypothetical protein
MKQLALGVGLLILAFIGGRLSAPRPNAPAAASPAEDSAAPRTLPDNTPGASPNTATTAPRGTNSGVIHVEDKLKAALAEKNPVKRAEQLQGLIPWLSRDQLIRVLQSKDGSSMNRVWYRHSVIARLAELDIAAADAFIRGEPESLRRQYESALLSGLAKSNPDAALQRIAAMPQNQQRRSALSQIVGVIAQTDPDRAMTLAQQSGQRDAVRSALQSIASIMAAEDPERALAWLNGRGDVDEAAKRDALRSIAFHLVESDPQRAVAVVMDNSKGATRDGSLFSVVHQWASRDPDAALAWATSATFKSARERSQAMSSIMSQIAQNDPDRALKLVLESTDPRFQRDAISSVFNGMVQKDPKAALEAAKRLPPSLRRQAESSAFSQWHSNDPEAAFEYVKSLKPSAENRRLCEVIGSHTYNLDPEQMEERGRWLLQNGVGRESQWALRNIAGNLAQSDVNRAIAFAQTLPAGDTQRDAISSAVSHWANNDPKAAADWVKAAGNAPGVNSWAQSVASQWAESDPAAAFAFANSLSNSDARRNSLSSVLGQWAEVDPATAAARAVTLPDDQRPNAVQQVANRWAQNDPDAALSWVLNQPDSDQRNNAIGSVVNNWTDQDPGAASQWLAKQPAGKMRDEAISQFLYSAARTEPESAIQWAGSISDESRRKERINWVAREWYRQDANAARAWVQSAQLDDAARKSLLDSMK